ncbi:putative ATPase [Streptosporangium becharense]|uniref:Putative ATPase n=1 Tax=Streptosporangium becharense TaxID=1816182 RepID=A0A7W9IF78_9ACTN|nr:NB-ARC domain-containing protein [Streptosporangium becharense]MBB2909413.1 putative ATPase [Streptosporangium becharense]MBB5819630.1 putative ATPase [Streptosporangium becharense]
MTQCGNLPVEMNTFVGRTAELDEIAKLLTRTRLLTLHGVAGVGKTRLALRAAQNARDGYPGGVWVVELSAETNGDLLAGAVAGMLGLHVRAERPAMESLTAFLADQRLLLILDTCEHLVGPCAELVVSILTGAPDVQIIVTSRQELGLPLEVVKVVEPFPVPPPEAADLAEYDAMSLFLDRARAVAPGIRTDERAMMAIARLCRRLDGVPLAIELAASHMRGLSAIQLADQLDDRFKLLADGDGPLVRHHTLRTAAGWSHELCTPAERLLWARLSVFTGAFDADSARGVCEDERLPDVPGVLASLVAKSVVARVGDRYRLLDTIREYGRDWLDELGEGEPMIRRHRDHYLSTALRMGAEWYGPRQLEWAYWAHRELPNIRTALDRCLSCGDHRAALELSGALWPLWCYLGFIREGRYYTDRALAAVGAPHPARSRPLWVAAHLALVQGDTALARSRAEEGVESARHYGDTEAEANAYVRLAVSRLLTADLDAARAYALRAAGRFREAAPPDTPEPICVPIVLAMAATFGGDLDEAVEILRETRLRCEARGEVSQRALSGYILSLALFGRGEITEAAAAAREALEVKWRLRDMVGSALAIDQLARIAAFTGDGRRAAWLLGAAQRVWIAFGMPGLGVDTMSEPRQAAATRATELIGEAAYGRSYEEGAASHIEAAVAYALRD